MQVPSKMSFQVLKKLIPRDALKLIARRESTAVAVPNNANQKDNDEPVDIKNPFEKDRAECILCRLNLVPSYKNVRLLSQFQSPYTGQIYGRHITGLCKARQEQVEKEIMRAQAIGLMPTYHKIVDFLKDPKLFDPERPLRPHKY